ncbi:MAG: protein kinase, partial [Myxococcota bacterium]
VERFALAQTHAKIVGGPPALIRLGRYVLLQRLGAGGMGTVFTAYDPELDRRIAIKVVHPGTSTTRASERLAREARALAKLSHPNIVTVFDTGVVGSEVFIAMELLRGKTFREWCAAGRTWREIRDLLLSAARGLAAAHEAGMVHRDFKPANVLIGEDDSVRVLDFGLATSVNDAGDHSGGGHGFGKLSTLTTVGNLLGTPAYMAPEQLLRGSSDARSDQFSFFVTFYEALYGQRPCSSTELAVLMRTMHNLQLPDSPPRRGVPQWLHRVLLRGLSSRPEARFESMAAVIEQLQSDRSARRRGIALAVVGLLATGTIGAVSARALAPTTAVSEPSAVADLVTRARAAAARSYFVYAPLDEPEQPSAYQVVVALEALADDDADTAARALRAEFADTLVRLGDHFWERDGGAPFSADYYAMALVFDPERATPRERTSLTRGELQSLTARAAAGSFTDAERLAGESLAALAEPDATEQARRVNELAAGSRTPSPTTLARLAELVDLDLAAEVDAPEVAAPLDRPSRSADRLAPAEDPLATALLDPTALQPAPPTANHDPEADAAATKRAAKRRAAELSASASTAADAGDLERAERLYREALSASPSSAKALAGLGRLAFDRGAYHRALQYARRAAKATPRNQGIQVLLGDAAFRVDYYDEARRAYVAAADLGSKTARARIAFLDSKVGTP